MGVSIRAYARHRGVAESTVRKALASGRITSEPDGTIDPAKADAAWKANTNVAKRRKRKRVPKAAGARRVEGAGVAEAEKSSNEIPHAADSPTARIPWLFGEFGKV